MPQIEQNQDQVTKLADLQLIKLAKKNKFINKFITIFNVPSNMVLVKRNLLFNPESKIEIKKSGLRIVNSLIRETYFVDTSTYTIDVKNQEQNGLNGRYSQDIGVGDDITLNLRIQCKVSKKQKDIEKLLKQKDVYKQALRAASEQIMKLLIQKNYKTNSETVDLNTYNNLKRDVYDISDIVRSGNPTGDETTEKIIDVALDLYQNFGLVITKMDFTDIDYSQRLKDERVKNITSEQQRERDKKDSENKKTIAQNEAEAKAKGIEKLQELFGNDTATLLTVIEKLPSDTVMNIGGNNNLSDIIAALKATNNHNNNNINGNNDQNEDSNQRVA